MGHGFIEAIRSVTHLVLARDINKLFFFLYSKSFLVFVWVFLSINLAPNSLLRVQKTFSAGPCSFSS